MDRQRSNIDATLATLAAAAAGSVTADQTNINARGLQIGINITAITGTTPSLTVTVQGKDAASGTYYTLLSAYNVAVSVYGSYAFIGKQGDFGSLNPSPPNAPPPVAPLGSAQNLLKLRLGVEGDRWRAFLVGENLLNGDKAFIISGSGIQRNYPRTLGLELRLNY